MKGLLGLVILAWAILALVDAMKGPLSASRKASWIILIIFLPLLGALAYFLFTRKISLPEIWQKIKRVYLRCKSCKKGPGTFYQKSKGARHLLQAPFIHLMKILRPRSFKFKVTLTLIACMFFSGALSNFLIYKFALDSQFSQLRDKLMVIAKIASLMVEAEILQQVPLNPEGINSPAYKIIAEKLRKIKEINPPLRYIYTMSKTDQEGIWQFVVDPDALTDARDKKSPTSYPGDKYDAGRFPEMRKSFSGPSADKKLEIDEWGVTLSGYAPIRDSHGKAIAMVGVDIQAEDIYKTQQQVHRRAILVLTLGVMLSIFLGALISRRVIRPLEKLVAAARSIANGNLKQQVKIQGNDEISELAHSFNQMAASLYRSQVRLNNYFYNTVQSLVRILEARDHYARGHSEKVAEYAQKIALKMGLPQDKVELLKEAAVLHDIGKLGIQEDILNKKEKLTDEEWERVRQHPIIAEDILKPVFLNAEMLTIIRGHHERYDGSGYPDKSSGDNINLFAQILSVADAFAAMTSQRAYRQALNKEEAIAEFKKNRGTQFNPYIVDILIQVVKEQNQVS